MKKMNTLLLSGFCAFTIICNAVAQSPGVSGRNNVLAGEIDAGGVSVDLALCRTEQAAPQGENLLKFSDFEDGKVDLKQPPLNNWAGAFYVHQKDGDALKEKIFPLTGRKISDDNPASGTCCAVLTTPLAVNEFRDDKGKPEISNRINQSIALPENIVPIKYQLSFNARGKYENSPGLNSLRAFAMFYDNTDRSQGKQLGEAVEFGFPLKADWQGNSINFIAPAGTRLIFISLALYGCGEAFLDDAEVRQVQMEDGVTVKLIPFAFLDNTFCLGTKQQGTLLFSFRNENAKKLDCPVLYLKVPDAFKLVDVRNILKTGESEKDAEGNVTYKVDISALKNDISKESYSSYHTASVMLKTDLEASEKLYPAEYWVEDGSYRSAPEKLNLKVIQASSGNTPKIFRSATMLSRESDFSGEGAKEFVSFYTGNGFNCVHGCSSIAVVDELKKAGISRYIQPGHLQDGYRIGDVKKTEDALFRLADGSPYNNPVEAICPVEVYKQGPYYKEHVASMLEKFLVGKDTADNIMPNWEPFMFDFKGCFCPRCKEEFILNSKLPRKEVDVNWPTSIITSYRDAWIKFRSQQHAMMMGTLEKTVNDLGRKAGKDSHFMPELAWSHFIESSNNEGGQYNPADYLAKLPWLEVWGPYIFQPFTKPYEYYTGIHLITFIAARDIKKFIADRVPDQAKRPKLIAFPHGYQLNDWVTEPEALGFEYLCFFLNGWEGAFAYYFPRGYDQRYWTELAKANSQIAEYENYVFKGKRNFSVNVAATSPLPATNFPESWIEGGNFLKKLPDLANASLLQCVSYELDNRVMLAVGNFWMKGEIFFNLKNSTLGNGRKYVLTQPDKKLCYANANGDIALTAADLKKGIMLQAGALRWNFYVLENYEAGKNYGKTVNPEMMNKVMKQRLPAIEKTIQLERELISAKKVQTAKELGTPDYSGIKDMSNAGVACLKKRVGDKTTVEFKSGDMTMMLDPALGGRLMSWTNGKDELVSQDEKTGLAVDAFWWPDKAVCSINTPYKVVSQSKNGNGLSITLEREITASDNHSLAGIIIRKTYDIASNGFTLTSEIINQTKKEISFSFRWHNMPGLFEIKNGAGGQAAMLNGDKPEIFPRMFICKLYRFAASPDKDLEGAFNMDSVSTITSPKTVFTAPWSKTKLSAEVDTAENLHCLIFWDSGKQKASTFEPVFSKVKLEPGQSWSASIKWKVN
jgi:hypothetical protein